MMGYASGFDLDHWRVAKRFSLAESARYADAKALAETRSLRLQGIWHDTAIELAVSGADLRLCLRISRGWRQQLEWQSP